MNRPRLVYVMGPSGAGKDTVLRLARASIGPGVLFARRAITRAPMDGDEEFEPVSAEEFERRVAGDRFVMHWEANGLRYGIGAEVGEALAGGGIAVVSGSRAHFAAAVAARDDVLPVLITASAATRATRLAVRGREDAAAISARLARGDSLAVDDPRTLTIVNDGPPADAAARLVAAIRRLREPPAG